MVSDKSKAVTTKFKQVRLGQDIPKFIDAVEAEAIRILEEHNLPTDSQQLSEIVIYETINNRKWIDAVKEAPDGDVEYRMPTSIYQAKRILTLALAARWHTKQSEFHDELNLSRDGLAFTVGEIVRLMYLSRLSFYIGIDSPKSKGNTGKKWPSTSLTEDAIKKTFSSKEHWEFNGNDVLDTLKEDEEVFEFMNDAGNPAFSLTYFDESGKSVTVSKSLKTIEIESPSLKSNSPNFGPEPGKTMF